MIVFPLFATQAIREEEPTRARRQEVGTVTTVLAIKVKKMGTSSTEQKVANICSRHTLKKMLTAVEL